ncbi:MAG: hypothetical protein HFE86_00350 [Clostridiales bacterium]|nr:hypothetical protein [Clostridiales bacterium]
MERAWDFFVRAFISRKNFLPFTGKREICAPGGRGTAVRRARGLVRVSKAIVCATSRPLKMVCVSTVGHAE